jgi:hypothetical protein
MLSNLTVFLLSIGSFYDRTEEVLSIDTPTLIYKLTKQMKNGQKT